MNLLDRIFGPTSLVYNLLRWLGITPLGAVLIVVGSVAVLYYIKSRE